MSSSLINFERAPDRQALIVSQLPSFSIQSQIQTISLEQHMEVVRDCQQSSEVATILSREVSVLRKQAELSNSELEQLKASNTKVVELLAAAQIKLKEFDVMLSQSTEQTKHLISEKEQLAAKLVEEQRKNQQISAQTTANKSCSDWKVILEEKAAAFVCLDCCANIPAKDFLEHECVARQPNGTNLLEGGVTQVRSRARLNTSLMTPGLPGSHQANLNTSSCLDSSVLTIRRTPTQTARRATTGLPDSGAGAILTQNYMIAAGDDSATPRRLSSKQTLEAEIVEVSVKESAHNKKLYAEYRIKATRGRKVWEAFKKYREFCEFASSITTWADPLIVASMPNTVQTLFKMVSHRPQPGAMAVGTSTIADRQSQVQDLLNWMCHDNTISESPQLKGFLQEPDSPANELVENLVLPEEVVSVDANQIPLNQKSSISRDLSSNKSALAQVLNRKQKFGSVTSKQGQSKDLTESPKAPSGAGKKDQTPAGLSLLRASASSYLNSHSYGMGTGSRSKKNITIHTQSTDRNDETNQSLSKRAMTDGFKQGYGLVNESPQKSGGLAGVSRIGTSSRGGSQQKLKNSSGQKGGKLVSNKPKQVPTEPGSPGVGSLGQRKKSTPQVVSRLSQKDMKLSDFGTQGVILHQASTPVFQGPTPPMSESQSTVANDPQNTSLLSKGVKPKNTLSNANLFSSPLIGSAARGLVTGGLGKIVQGQ